MESYTRHKSKLELAMINHEARFKNTCQQRPTSEVFVSHEFFLFQWVETSRACFSNVRSGLAKPLKPLGGECWLIGATTKFDDVFGSWNQQVVMVSWLPPRNENMKNKVVMAATKPIHEMVGSDQIDSLQVNDPWSQYKVTTNNSIKQDGRNSGPPRSIDGPIEQKFQSQGNQISTLQTQVEHISKQLEKQVQDHGEMKQSVHQEFCKIREETSRGLSDMQKSFDESLHKALQNQDLQLTRNFSELKNLILQKPNPMKKAKTAPAGSGQKRENDDDEEANE